MQSLGRLHGVIAADIGSFIVAFAALQFYIKIPESKSERKESVLVLAKEGIVTSCSGAAMIIGSLIVSALPKR